MCGKKKVKGARTCIKCQSYSSPGMKTCIHCGTEDVPSKFNSGKECKLCVSLLQTERARDSCPTCGKPKKVRASSCWKCFSKNRRIAADAKMEKRRTAAVASAETRQLKCKRGHNRFRKGENFCPTESRSVARCRECENVLGTMYLRIRNASLGQEDPEVVIEFYEDLGYPARRYAESYQHKKCTTSEKRKCQDARRKLTVARNLLQLRRGRTVYKLQIRGSIQVGTSP